MYKLSRSKERMSESKNNGTITVKDMNCTQLLASIWLSVETTLIRLAACLIFKHCNFCNMNFRVHCMYIRMAQYFITTTQQAHARLICRRRLLTCLWRIPSEDLQGAHTRGWCAHARSFCVLWFSPAACWSSSRSSSPLKPARRERNGWSPELSATKHAEPPSKCRFVYSFTTISFVFGDLGSYVAKRIHAQILESIWLLLVEAVVKKAYMSKRVSERLLFNFLN